MIKKFLLPIIIVCAAVALFILLQITRPQTAVNEKPEKKWLVDAVTAKFSDIAPEVTLYGRIETPRDTTLTAALNADVDNVYTLEGQRVEANQLLIQLDETDINLLLAQRQAEVAEVNALIESEQQRFNRDKGLLANQQQLVTLADNAVDRAKKLGASKLASQATLDEASSAYQQQALALKQLQHDINEHPARLAQLQANLKRAEALLNQTEVDLQRTQIRAPFSGRIAALNVAEGDRIRIGDPLIQIYDTSQLEVRAQIPGRYIKQVTQYLQQGDAMTARATVDGKPVTLKLDRLSGQVRPDSGGVDGLFRIEANNPSFALGTFVTLQLQLGIEQNVVEIPFSALYGLNRVYLIDNGVMRSVPIKRVGEIHHADGRHTLLIRGEALSEGSQIVATQLPNALTGLAVEIAP